VRAAGRRQSSRSATASSAWAAVASLDAASAPPAAGPLSALTGVLGWHLVETRGSFRGEVHPRPVARLRCLKIRTAARATARSSVVVDMRGAPRGAGPKPRRFYSLYFRFRSAPETAIARERQ